MDKITEKLTKKLEDMVAQKVEDALKKYWDTTNKKLEKTQKQLNELREDFDKHKSEIRGDYKKRDMK
jgi:uncharacterized protein Yka (UPF0111/DUF47 family)